MSANNSVVIYRAKDKWKIKHIDLDCGELKNKFPEFDNLEEAVKCANRFIDYCEREGFGVEYGLKIIT